MIKKTTTLFRDHHDLSLPLWGPYSKKFFGISHINDLQRGFRFDFAIMPGLYRRDISIPDAHKEAAYSPNAVSTNLDFYAYRQQLEWKDRLYCDISFSRISDHLILVRCECVNHTESKNSFALHCISGLQFPELRRNHIELPSGGIWLNAVDNIGLHFQTPRPSDGLVYDGWRRGEEICHDTANGSCIGQGFGQESGDSIKFSYHGNLQRAAILLRYCLPENHALRIQLQGICQKEIQLCGNGTFQTINIYSGSIEPGTLEIISQGGSAIQLDGLAIIPENQTDEVIIQPCDWDAEPYQQPGPVEDSMVIRFIDTDCLYGLWWSHAKALKRKYLVDNLQNTLLYDDAVHQHFIDNFNRGGSDKYSDVLMQPITVPAQSSTTVYLLLADGNNEEIIQRLNAVDKNPEQLEKFYRKAQNKQLDFAPTIEGEKYLTSQQIMAAVTMTNVIFPVYTKRRFIRHCVPGRCWNMLYTWDSGFIGLGLLELDPVRAIETLNTYVTEPGDTETAFIHHGSPVPVQHYLFHEICNRISSPELRQFFYPRLKQYYDFLAGKINGSTTANLKSGLLKTWDYFYNSGGWDDYPPQLYTHQQHLEPWVSPVVVTAHTIRAARILSRTATDLGLADDAAEFQRDIDRFSDALQQYSWDADAGYFSYVIHDDDGCPVSHLKHESGVNFNMGLDGMTPLLAGICTSEQKKLMFARLESSANYWTEVGLSTVDMSAPYYRRDGYWNGAVWMPYQWFFWKCALNEGKADLAWKIASRGLELWQQETGNTYYCFEHFNIETGHGAGWHHFSGLSTPVLCWFGAYYRPGRLTAGYDVTINNLRYYSDCMTAELHIDGNIDEITTLIAVTGQGRYRCEYAGKVYPLRERIAQTWEVDLPKGTRGRLIISQ